MYRREKIDCDPEHAAVSAWENEGGALAQSSHVERSGTENQGMEDILVHLGSLVVSHWESLPMRREVSNPDQFSSRAASIVEAGGGLALMEAVMTEMTPEERHADGVIRKISLSRRILGPPSSQAVFATLALQFRGGTYDT